MRVWCKKCHFAHTKAMVEKYQLNKPKHRPQLRGQAQWDDLFQKRLAEKPTTQRIQQGQYHALPQESEVLTHA